MFALAIFSLLTGLLLLLQIMKLSNKVWNSPMVRAELSRLAADAELNSEVLVRSVKTRWNTVVEVLERALEMKEVLGDLCDMVQFNRPGSVRLRRFMLTDSEWEILAQLHQLLDVRSHFLRCAATLTCTFAAIPVCDEANFYQHSRSSPRSYSVH